MRDGLMFMASSITYSLVKLTIDGTTSFLQLMEVQNVRKNTRFSPNKNYGKFLHYVHNFKMVESL